MKRVTVLMPVYNGEAFLIETIDSVLNQSYTDFDLLIINDGSTDSTEEIIKSYNDTRIIYIENEKNIGYIRTLNRGLDMIDSEFIARMDADDLWVSSKLEKQINLLDEKPEIGICGTSIRKFGVVEGDFIFPIDNVGLRVGFLFFCKMSHPSVVFRTSFLNETGLRYREDFHPAEDYKMWVDSIDKTQIWNIPEILVYYRQHPSQVTKPTDPKQILTINSIRNEMLGKVSPRFADEEKKFHNDIFLNGIIQSATDYRRFIKWSATIQSKNLEAGSYLDQDVLKNEMNIHIQVKYKMYILDKYFKEFNLKTYLNYFISLEWIYLSLKRNIKLILKQS